MSNSQKSIYNIEMKTGMGFTDIVLYIKNQAYIFELKFQNI